MNTKGMFQQEIMKLKGDPGALERMRLNANRPELIKECKNVIDGLLYLSIMDFDDNKRKGLPVSECLDTKIISSAHEVFTLMQILIEIQSARTGASNVKQ